VVAGGETVQRELARAARPDRAAVEGAREAAGLVAVELEGDRARPVNDAGLVQAVQVLGAVAVA
jgi:hypothetical protein